MKINNIGIKNDEVLLRNKLNNKIVEENNNASFKDYLKEALNKVNELQINADNYKKLLATGEVENLHDVTIAAEKANIGLLFITSVRNKVVEAYREIMRMQI